MSPFLTPKDCGGHSALKGYVAPKGTIFAYWQVYHRSVEEGLQRRPAPAKKLIDDWERASFRRAATFKKQQPLWVFCRGRKRGSFLSSYMPSVPSACSRVALTNQYLQYYFLKGEICHQTLLSTCRDGVRSYTLSC